MIIEFNKKLELIFGLLYSANKDHKLFKEDTFLKSTLKPYCEEFYQLYKKYASNELKEYIKKGGLASYDLTAKLALSLDENYNLSQDMIQSIENIPAVNAVVLSRLLKEFVIKSNYEEFYKNHYPIFEELIKKYKTALNKYVTFNEDIITNFYGYKIKKFKIYLFNFVNGSFGINLEESIYNLNSSLLNKNLEFSPRIINTCFHEFSHPYINPLGYKYFKDINIEKILEEAIANNLEDCYCNQVILINEYLVRGIQVYLASKYMEKDYIERQIFYHKSRGYVYIEEVINLLNNKDSYSNFEEFYKNEIVPYFIELNDKIERTPKH